MPIAFAITAAKWLLGRLSALFGIVARYPWQALSIALCVLLWASWHRADRYRDKLDAANKIIAAGEANVRTLKAEKAATEARNTATTERINHETIQAHKDALAADDAYARTHQCVQPPAVAAAPGDAAGSVPSLPDTSGRTDAPSGAAIVVSRGDLDACTLNTVSAQKWYEWAKAISGNTAPQGSTAGESP